MHKKNKRAIALLITVLFIIAISIAVGIGLKQVKEAAWHVENENFMFQTSMILDDVLTLLKTSQELNAINSTEALYIFLNQTSFIPLESSGIKVIIELKSARSKFNINSLTDANGTIYEDKKSFLEQYMNQNMVNISFVDMLLDNMGRIKEDNTYRSDIFNEKPYLFRDYIVSEKHLDEIIDSYLKFYHDKSVKNINYDNLFYYSIDRNTKIDLNYATPEVWQLMLGCDQARAVEYTLGAGTYTKIEDLDLNVEEMQRLSKFNPSYLELYLDVAVEIIQDDKNAKLKFEYDMKTKKGSKFVYDI